MRKIIEKNKEKLKFAFGKNWKRFLSVVNEERIKEAEKSLVQMLGVENLHGKIFLDIGCGSGLFSLAAKRLGAKVHSFDYDKESVDCTKLIKQKYFPEDQNWIVEQGDILNIDYIKPLGTYDVVYSWGVLHHTGTMWQALKNVIQLVSDGGILFISIYNDQGAQSIRWRRVKHFYCSGRIGRILVLGTFIPYFVFRDFISDILRFRNPLKQYTEYKRSRGMSKLHDMIDWLGGYPFEVAKPEEIFEFYKNNGFLMLKLKTCGGGLGCNEYIFVKK